MRCSSSSMHSDGTRPCCLHCHHHVSSMWHDPLHCLSPYDIASSSCPSFLQHTAQGTSIRGLSLHFRFHLSGRREMGREGTNSRHEKENLRRARSPIVKSTNPKFGSKRSKVPSSLGQHLDSCLQALISSKSGSIARSGAAHRQLPEEADNWVQWCTNGTIS